MRFIHERRGRTMNIRDAAIEAHKEGKAITRRQFIKECKSSPIKLIGTNTNECFLIVGNNSESVTPRWEPYLEDITADDWCVVY